MEKKLNWLVLGDWVISKRDLQEGILNCRYRKNFHMITHWPRTELSPVLALIISSLISKQYPSATQLAELNQSEIQFLQKLIQRTRIDFVLPAQFKSKTGKGFQTLDNKSTMLKQLKILISEFMSGNSSMSIKSQIRSLIKTMLSKNIT